MQLYAIKTVVEIDRVRLNIRFPGTLSFQFKNTQLYEDLPKVYPLVNGECSVGESVALEVEAVYNPREDSYAEVPVELVVSINTVSGKIAAGTITFNAIQNNTLTLPLKRCSDKTAEATLNIGFARIQKVRDVEEEPIPVKQRSQSRLMAQARSKEKRSFEDIRQPPSMFQTERKQIPERNQSKDSPGLMASKVVRPVLLGTGLASESRLKEVEENCDRKLRQVNREKEEMEGQVESAREKWKMAERREKQLQTALKDTREQSEKRRVKISDLEGKLAENQKTILEYERRAKATQQQARLSVQRMEEATAKYQLLERKLQGRQQSLGDRERRLAQKLSQLQGEHSRTVHEYNLLLEKMEVQEKANQTIFKNKERAHLEERAKWKEASEKYERAYKKLQEEHEDLNARYNSLVTAESNIKVKFADLEASYDLLRNADESRRLYLEREEAAKRELQRELQALRSLEGDKAVLKKKINEGNQEQLKSKEKADKLFLQNEELKEGLKNAEKAIQQYKREKKATSSRCAQLQRTVSQQEKEITRLSGEGNTLSSKNTYLNERLNDLKTKSDQETAVHTEQETQMQAKISSLLQSKQYLEADIEDLKWTLEKAEENIAECERKLKERSQDTFRLQEETMKLQKEREDLSQELQERERVSEGLKNELADGKRREQEGQDALKQRDRKIYDQQKRISQLEQEHFMSSSKLTNNLQDYRDTLANKDEIIQQLTDQTAAKQTKITEMQNSLEKLEEESQDQAREIKLLTLSLDEADRNLKLEKETGVELKKNNEVLKRQLSEAQSKLSSEEQDSLERIETLTSTKTSLEKQLQGRESDLDSYKRAVQQLLMITAKDEQVRMEEVVAVPDTALAKNQLEALRSRNKYLSDYRNSISELKVEISYLQKEVEAKTAALTTKNEELQTAIKKHTQRTVELEGEWQRSADDYVKQIEALQSQLAEIRSERQKLQNKHKGLGEAFEQQRACRQELQQQLGAVKEELKAQQKLNLQLRSREISKKGEDESLIHNLKVELKAQLDKHQETITVQQSQIQAHLKTISDREKQIASLKGQLASTQQEKSKTETSLQEIQEKYSKLNEDKTATDQALLQAQKRVTALKQDLEKAQGETASERELKNTLQEKLKESHEHASELMVDRENLQSRLDSIHKSSTFSQEEQKGRIAQLEEALQAEGKKAKKYFKDLTERSGELELKDFLTKQLEQKLADHQTTAADLRKEIEEKRNTINRLTASIEDQNRVLMAAEKEKSDISQEKSAAQDEITLKKERIGQLEAQLKELAAKLQKNGHQLEDSRTNEEELRKEQITLQNSLAQLRENLNESRKEAQRLSARQSEGRTKLSLLQQQLREKEEFYQNHKSKNWEQNQRQVSGLREKSRQLEGKLDTLLVEREEERENLKNEIDYVTHSNQELEELLQEKEGMIEQQDAELLQAHARIISLNGELRNCLEAWEKEKTASLPSRRQTAKIQDDIGKFQAYAADLERKAKEMLNTAVLRAKDEVIAKISQSLVELLQLLHRSKSRALSRASDIDRDEISREYDRIREKAEELLRANRGMNAG